MRAGRRAVVELMAHIVIDGNEVDWPVAVVADSPNDRSVTFRTYCSQWPLTGERGLRPAILDPRQTTPLRDVVARLFAALEGGDADAAVDCFASDGYLREATDATHVGTTELRSYFTEQLSLGGVGLQPCAETDDGQRCAVEYTCVRWGGRDLPPQAGLGVYERGANGLLAAVRLYDDIEPLVA